MRRKDHGSPQTDTARAGEITRVIEDVLRRREAGLSVGDETVLQEHPDLMPELGERLRLLRGIQSAALHARRSSSDVDENVPPEPILEESRRFLREALTGYEIFEEVHYGGQGVVYKAFQVAAKRPVAIKVLLDGPLASARQRHRFEREVELISRLRHPNIVTVYDSGLVRGRHYCVMEFVEGLTIDDHVMVEDLTVREVVRLFLKVCRAVGYAHQHGVIHRDLSPANILVDLDGEPHVLDFGLAKDVWASGGRGSIVTTAEGQCVGTLPYLSPEQAGGLDGQVDVRSDVYALGVTLFKLLTGVFPYPVHDSPAKVRDRIISEEPLRLRKALTIPEAEGRREPQTANQDLETILTKVLRKDKEERYRSAAEFADDLQRYLAGDAVQARTSSGLYVFHRTLRKHRGLVAVVSLFLILLLASTAAVTMLWTQARTQRENAREVARVANTALGSVVGEIEDAIRPLAGGVQVRDELLRGVAANLDRLRPLVEADAAMEDLLGKMREKQGDITLAQGRTKEAIEHYEACLAIAERQAQADPTGVASLIEVSRIHRMLATALKDPASHYRQAIAAAESVLNREPDSQDGQYELCRNHIDYSQYLSNTGSVQAAVDHAAAGLRLAETAVANGTKDLLWEETLARALTVDGKTKWRSGDGDAAMAAIEKTLALREKMIREHPANVEFRHNLLQGEMWLGRWLVDAGQIAQAKPHLTKAMELGDYLTRVDPTNGTWRLAACRAHESWVALLYDLREFDQMAPHCELLMALSQSLVDSDPLNPDWQLAMAFALSQRGRLRLEQGNSGGAYEDFTAALAIRESLAAIAAGTNNPWDLVACSHENLAKCERKLGAMDLALQHHLRAYELRRMILEQDSTAITARLDVALSQLRVATLYMFVKTPEADRAALDWFQEAEANLNACRDAGRLHQRDGIYNTYISAIHQNRMILAENAEERSCAQEAQAEALVQASPAPPL